MQDINLCFSRQLDLDAKTITGTFYFTFLSNAAKYRQEFYCFSGTGVQFISDKCKI